MLTNVLVRRCGTDCTPGRLDELARFIEHWYGPHRADYSIPESELDQHTLPDPLRRLYALAGNWPVPLCYQLAGQQDTSRLLFNHRDSLYRPPLSPSVDATDRIEFAAQDEGFWLASTDQTGADPVVVSGDYSDRSLTDFLVRFCIRQTVWGDPQVNNVPRDADLLVADLDPMLDACAFPNDGGPLPVFMPTPNLLLMGSPDSSAQTMFWSCARRNDAQAGAHAPTPISLGFDLGPNADADDSNPPWRIAIDSTGVISL